MTKFWKWMEIGVSEATERYWREKTFTQWWRDIMFLLLILPVGVLRAMFEPVHLAVFLFIVGFASGAAWLLFLLGV